MQQVALSEATAARRRIPITLCTEDGFPIPGQTLSASEIKTSKNGAAEADSAGSFVEVTNQGYYYQATQAEFDTRGFLRLRCNKVGFRFHGFFVDVQVGAEAQNGEGFLALVDGIESGLTPKQCFQAIFATGAGKLSGAGTGTETFRNKADNVNRVVATVDANGNRTAVSYTFS